VTLNGDGTATVTPATVDGKTLYSGSVTVTYTISSTVYDFD